LSATITKCLRDTGKKGDTERCYRRNIVRLRDWLVARGSTLLEATESDLEEFFADPEHRKSDATYNVVCSSLRCFYRWAYGKGLMEHDPTRNFRSKRRPPRRSYDWDALESEVSTVIESIPCDSPLGRRDRVMIELMLELGLSCNGVAMLRVDQFSRDGFVTFRHNQTSVVEYKLPEGLAKRVIDYIDHDQRGFCVYDEDRWILFPSRWGGTLLRQSMWKTIVKRSRAVGVEISPKKIRCATVAKMTAEGRTSSDVVSRLSLSPDRVRFVMSEILRSRGLPPENDPQMRAAAV
jgi:integrase/recombinase XerD